MTETITPPTLTLLAERLSHAHAEGLSPAALDPDQLLGLDETLLPLLDERDRQAAVVREEQALSVYRTLGLGLVGRGEAAVLYESSFAGYAKANEVAGALSDALPAGASALLVSANGPPEHTLLTRHAPAGWLVLACPLEVGEGERQSFAGFRLMLDAACPPEGSQPVRDRRGRVLGWVCPDGRTLRLHFHPFASSGRLTVSRREQRIALTRELIELARPHLHALAAAGNSLPAGELAQWRAARADAQALIAHARVATQQPLERLTTAEREQRDAARRVEHLTAQLCDAIQAESEAQARASELRPLAAREAAAAAEHLAESVAAINALPAVLRCELVEGSLRVETAAHTFRLPLMATEELLVVEPASAESLDRDQRPPEDAQQPDRSRDEIFLPLALALADRNFVAAVQIAVGLFAR